MIEMRAFTLKEGGGGGGREGGGGEMAVSGARMSYKTQLSFYLFFIYHGKRIKAHDRYIQTRLLPLSTSYLYDDRL